MFTLFFLPMGPASHENVYEKNRYSISDILGIKILNNVYKSMSGHLTSLVLVGSSLRGLCLKTKEYFNTTLCFIVLLYKMVPLSVDFVIILVSLCPNTTCHAEPHFD